jgi:hypothetical protein
MEVQGTRASRPAAVAGQHTSPSKLALQPGQQNSEIIWEVTRDDRVSGKPRTSPPSRYMRDRYHSETPTARLGLHHHQDTLEKDDERPLPQWDYHYKNYNVIAKNITVYSILVKRLVVIVVERYIIWTPNCDICTNLRTMQSLKTRVEAFHT